MTKQKRDFWCVAFTGFIVYILLAWLLAGCSGILQSLHNIAADPNTSGALESAAEGAAGVAGFFGPVGGLLAGALSTGLLVWRKAKPVLAAAKTQVAQVNAAGTAMTQAIEMFRRANPDQWGKLGKLIEGQMSEQGIDSLVVENVIRGLRGLPLKEAA